MLEYLSEILNINLLDNELLRTSLEGFIPHQLLEQLMESKLRIRSYQI